MGILTPGWPQPPYYVCKSDLYEYTQENTHAEAPDRDLYLRQSLYI
jgi:hypothetical protein